MPLRPPLRPSSGPAALSRRAVLLGAAGAVLGGCTGGIKIRRDGRGPGPDRPEDRTAEVDPDVALAATALAEERAALTVVEATLDRHVRLRGELEPLAVAHRAHVDLLADAVPDEQAPESPTSTAVRVPRSARRAVARLVELETELAANGRRHAFAAQSGPFARLLASMSGSAAQNVALLDQVTVGERGRR